MNITYEFRPLPEYTDVIRYADGLWIPDDGEYDTAFVCKGESGYPAALWVRHHERENIEWTWLCKNNWHNRVSNHPKGRSWHYMIKPGTKDKGEFTRRDWNGPNDIAMSKCFDLYRCANGRPVEFSVNDPYIEAGLVRNIETKEILTPPKVFLCMYCGPILWRVAERIEEQLTLFEEI